MKLYTIILIILSRTNSDKIIKPEVTELIQELVETELIPEPMPQIIDLKPIPEILEPKEPILLGGSFKADLSYCERALKNFLEPYQVNFDFEIKSCEGQTTNSIHYRMVLFIYKQRCELSMSQLYGKGPFDVYRNTCFTFEADQEN